MKVSQILDFIDNGLIALPEFQRGYVWSREQVRGFMDSLYRGHPVGGLLVWATQSDQADARGEEALPPGVVKLLLDGQQRITTLYGVIRGRPPRFFDGNAKAFLDLYFHLEDEVFEFYGPVKMGQDPRWISVTDLMQKGVGEFFKYVHERPQLVERLPVYMERMNALASIKDRDFHVDEITDPSMTVDVVVEDFNRVNSGGTKLSKGDLALAKICAGWPQAREEMQARLEKWRRQGYHFRLDLLLRTINAVVTGEAFFSALRDVSTADFREGLQRAERHIDTILNLVSSRLGLDHDRVLKGRYSLPLLARYLEVTGGKLDDHVERDRLLYWYVHAMLWGRYAGSSETALNQDLAAVEDPDGAMDRLIGLLRQQRGELRLRAADFLGFSRGARFYPLLYMLTRVYGSKDWGSGIELRRGLLGGLSGLQLHHIFPKAKLYEAGYGRHEVNALANFSFLTQETNLAIRDRDPAEYLPEVAERFPGALESHWIPMDPELWRIERYPEFLEARRELLARAGNAFLDDLLHGVEPAVSLPDEEAPAAAGAAHVASGVSAPPAEEATAPAGTEEAIPGSIDSDEELELLESLNRWVAEVGFAEGELEYELVDEESGAPLAVLDLAWPEGLQPGLSEPVAVLLDEPPETEERANHAGFRFFSDPEAFRGYVTKRLLGVEAGGSGFAPRTDMAPTGRDTQIPTGR